MKSLMVIAVALGAVALIIALNEDYISDAEYAEYVEWADANELGDWYLKDLRDGAIVRTIYNSRHDAISSL